MAPWRKGDASVIYVLARVRDGQREIAGVFSSAKKAQTEVARIVGREVGKPIQKLPGWMTDGGTLLFAYGRDHHDFRFQVTLWPVDAETS
jgi:hypothetical protein